MDPILLALTLDLQARARAMTQSNSLEMQFAAADILDHLGARMDEEASLQKVQATLGEGQD